MTVFLCPNLDAMRYSRFVFYFLKWGESFLRWYCELFVVRVIFGRNLTGKLSGSTDRICSFSGVGWPSRQTKMTRWKKHSVPHWKPKKRTWNFTKRWSIKQRRSSCKSWDNLDRTPLPANVFRLVFGLDTPTQIISLCTWSSFQSLMSVFSCFVSCGKNIEKNKIFARRLFTSWRCFFVHG